MFLTIKKSQDLIGKTIEWRCNGAKENTPYTGIAKILSVFPDKRNPIKVKIISGDDLNFAFTDIDYNNEEADLFFSDADRAIPYQVIE